MVFVFLNELKKLLLFFCRPTWKMYGDNNPNGYVPNGHVPEATEATATGQ